MALQSNLESPYSCRDETVDNRSREWPDSSTHCQLRPHGILLKSSATGCILREKKYRANSQVSQRNRLHSRVAYKISLVKMLTGSDDPFVG